jgi:hypothetical protein
MALGSTQPLTEMSTRCISWGKGGRCVRLTTLPPSCAVVTKSGNLNFLEPFGSLQACNGTALPFTRWGGWLKSRSGRFTPGKDPVPIVQETWWARGLSGRVRKISPPPGFDPRTVQPVASHNTNSPQPTSDKYGKSKSPCGFYSMLLLVLKGEYVDYDDVVVRFASVTRYGGKLFVFQLVLIIPTSYAIHHPRMSLENLWEN